MEASRTKFLEKDDMISEHRLRMHLLGSERSILPQKNDRMLKENADEQKLPTSGRLTNSGNERPGG